MVFVVYPPMLRWNREYGLTTLRLSNFNLEKGIFLFLWSKELWNAKREIVGERYNDLVFIKEFLNTMSGEMGFKISEPKLCGMYSQRWKGNSSFTIIHYYRAIHADGVWKIPTGCTDIKWYSYEEALKIIPYQDMTMMMREIKIHPGKTIGASFERYKDQNNNIQYVTLENFYVMN